MPPAYGDPAVRPANLTDIRIEKEGDRKYLVWSAPEHRHGEHETDAVRFVVYEFYSGEKQDIEDPQAIVALTPYRKMLIDPDAQGVTYAVTALDRMNRESEPIFLYNQDN